MARKTCVPYKVKDMSLADWGRLNQNTTDING